MTPTLQADPTAKLRAIEEYLRGASIVCVSIRPVHGTPVLIVHTDRKDPTDGKPLALLVWKPKCVSVDTVTRLRVSTLQKDPA